MKLQLRADLCHSVIEPICAESRLFSYRPSIGCREQAGSIRGGNDTGTTLIYDI